VKRKENLIVHSLRKDASFSSEGRFRSRAVFAFLFWKSALEIEKTKGVFLTAPPGTRSIALPMFAATVHATTVQGDIKAASNSSSQPQAVNVTFVSCAGLADADQSESEKQGIMQGGNH